ncbi:fibronectin type III domain-containing protein [Archangium violaceum]|uniref:fibronectin type III domain-containing protein n=1 Tax=Archangium violaceum TaxID=83451 RepID=UPI00193AFF76|nr:fibronectin type III domain-containing protein [Archangium violaceum]QRK08082.1 fibronectin type III domain-containing protein [Archangium violaceum]
MRPLLEQQLRLLRSPAPYSIRGRVRVLLGSTWYDLSNLFGRDFLDSVDVDEGLDNPVGQASVRVMRELQGLSLAPLMETSRANNLPGSYAPLLQAGRPFRVEAAVVPLGFEPQAAAWRPLFFGRIDRVDSGPELITFTGRDMAGVLQDVWVPEGTYGSDGGTPLETVCNQLLVAAQLSDFALYTPEASRQLLGKYKQERQPAMDALSSRAIGRGWEVRWKLRPDTGDWGLWLWGPDRAGTTPVWTYGPRDYQYLGEFTTSLENVRTRVEVTYSDEEDLDAAGQPKRKTVPRENEEATKRYGYITSAGVALPRTMWLAEATTSGIRTHAEAVRLAEAGLADLSTEDVGAFVEVRFHPGIELADLVQLAPNGSHFTTAQVLAVRQVTHTLTSTDGKTRLAVNGKPSLGARQWLNRNADGYTAPTVAFTGPAPPSGLVVTNSVSGAVLLFTAPNVTSGGSVPEEYELHVYTAPGSTLSAATLKAVSSSTRFDLTGLAAGVPCYARVRSRDRKGNVGLPSDEVALTPRYVEPRLLQPLVSLAQSLLLNSDFEAANDVGAPPDAWTMAAGTWGTDITLSSDAYTGARSVVLVNNGGALVSGAVSVRPGGRYSIDMAAKVASTLAGLLVNVDWLSATLATIDSSNPQSADIAANTWGYVRTVVVAPAGARYARVRLFKPNGNGALAWVDSVVFAQVDSVEETPTSVSTINGYQNGWTAYATNGSGACYYRDGAGRVHIEGMIRGGIGNTVAFTLPSGYRPPVTRPFPLVCSDGPGWAEVSSNGDVRIVSGSATWTSLCGISFRAA